MAQLVPQIRERLVRFWTFLKDDLDILPGKSVRLRVAEETAKTLLARDVRRVYLFGSLARVGDGEDVDLIVEVDKDSANEFFRRVRLYAGTPEEGYRGKASIRLYIAHQILKREYLLGLSRNIFKNYGRVRNFFRLFDIFLVPPNWQSLDLQEYLPTEDPQFFTNITRDAKPYNPDLGCFEGIGPLRFWSKYYYNLVRWCQNLKRSWGWKIFVWRNELHYRRSLARR